MLRTRVISGRCVLRRKGQRSGRHETESRSLLQGNVTDDTDLRAFVYYIGKDSVMNDTKLRAVLCCKAKDSVGETLNSEPLFVT